MTDKKYRVREHVSTATVTNKKISVYYTIERRVKRYFNLFGPDEWITLWTHGYDGEIVDITYSNLDVAKVECERLNKNLPASYTETSIIDDNKLSENKISNSITVDEEELFEILTKTYISIKEDYNEFKADCDSDLLEKIHKFMSKNYAVRWTNFRLEQEIK